MLQRALIDGSSYIFRAYYGMRPLHDDDGNNINAVYGFFKMLLNLLETQPDYMLIARDSPGPTLRKQQHDDYKANRTRAPDDLIAQIRRIHDIVDERALPYSGMSGYEADDIIATYSIYPPHSDLHTSIYSSDKDLKQLIGPTISCVDPVKNEHRDYQRFCDHRGFAPTSIVDYLALIGDSADNIPGVPGIGPKSALSLIQHYTTIENLYEHLANNTVTISPSQHAKLIAGRDSAFRSKELITLMQLPDPASYMGLDDMQYSIDLDRRQNVLVDTVGFSSFLPLLEQHRTRLNQASQPSLW